MINEMRVTKRNGDLQDMFFDKILTRVTKIDELTAEQCAMSSTQHPDYNVLAGWILISNHQKKHGTFFFLHYGKSIQFYRCQWESCASHIERVVGYCAFKQGFIGCND